MSLWLKLIRETFYPVWPFPLKMKIFMMKINDQVTWKRIPSENFFEESSPPTLPLSFNPFVYIFTPWVILSVKTNYPFFSAGIYIIGPQRSDIDIKSYLYSFIECPHSWVFHWFDFLTQRSSLNPINKIRIEILSEYAFHHHKTAP